MNLSFTTTATCRPEIIRKTYHSFVKNLHGVDFSKTTLYINIDPAPDAARREETLEVAKCFFGRVIHRFPEKPNFTSSVNWLWSIANSDYILHLEDDWELIKPIDINDIMRIFNKNKQINQVAFRAYKFSYDKMCLSPSVLSNKMYKNFAGKLDETKNPEIQLRTDFVSPEMIHCIGKKPIIKDIGRSWISNTGLKKPDKKFNFIKWENN